MFKIPSIGSYSQPHESSEDYNWHYARLIPKLLMSVITKYLVMWSENCHLFRGQPISATSHKFIGSPFWFLLGRLFIPLCIKVPDIHWAIFWASKELRCCWLIRFMFLISSKVRNLEKKESMRFEFPTMVKILMLFFWSVMPCRLVGRSEKCYSPQDQHHKWKHVSLLNKMLSLSYSFSRVANIQNTSIYHSTSQHFKLKTIHTKLGE